MYAVIRTGGKQYRVTPDQELQVEKINAEEGERVEFSDVLMLAKDGQEAQVGTPLVEGARVSAEVLEQGRGEKIIVFKKKRRKNYRRKNGHRQHLTTVRILEVLDAGEKPKTSNTKTTNTKADKAKKKPGEGGGGVSQADPGEGLGGAPKKVAKGKTEKAAPAKANKQPAAKAEGKKARPAGFEKLDAPQGEPDDLKALPGVGPKLADKLNEYGIFHYHQLAAMSEDDLNQMDSALNLRGRATRDDWAGQAKQMMEDNS